MSTPKPGADTILRIWERGRHEHPVDRALTTLSALTGLPRGQLAALPVEDRDRQLLEARETLFGPTLAGAASCRQCGCTVDVSVRATPPAPVPQTLSVTVGEATVSVRMPTSLDLAAIAGCPDVTGARDALASRLIGVEDPSPELVEATLAELDLHAGVSAGLIELSCPDCGCAWSVELDVATFMWRELEVAAGRLLRDVDVLACRYGWSEHDILALGADRRHFYLELAAT